MNVILYSTHCPRCVVLEEKLEDADINFELIEDQDIMQEKGFMSAPMLEVDGQVMDFAKANKWINSLSE
jgi:glutaredoxin-related protein